MSELIVLLYLQDTENEVQGHQGDVQILEEVAQSLNEEYKMGKKD